MRVKKFFSTLPQYLVFKELFLLRDNDLSKPSKTSSTVS